MTTIRLRHSATPGNVPGSLQVGEVAINEADKRLYHRDSAGAVKYSDLAGAGGRNLLGAITQSGMVTATATAGVTLSFHGWAITNATNQTMTVDLIDGPFVGTKALRFTFAVAPTGGGYVQIVQYFDFGSVGLLAGRMVSSSFYFRSTNTPIVQSRVVQMYDYLGTGGGSAPDANYIVNETHSSSANWTRHSATVLLPSIAGKTLGHGNLSTWEHIFVPTGATTYDAGCFQFNDGPLTDYYIQDNFSLNPPSHYRPIVLGEDTTFYVRADGHDIGDGLNNTAAGAFASLQYACDFMKYVDARGWNVTIKVADGTYNKTLTTALAIFAVWCRPKNAKTFKIIGNTSTPANVVLNMNVTSGGGAWWYGFLVGCRDDFGDNGDNNILVEEINGFKFTATGSAGSDWVPLGAVYFKSRLESLKNIVIGSGFTDGIYASYYAHILIKGSISVEPSALTNLVAATFHSTIQFTSAAAITFVNAITVSAVLKASYMGLVRVDTGTSFTNPGNVTGQQWNLINVSGLLYGAVTIPGSGTTVNSSAINGVWTA